VSVDYSTVLKRRYPSKLWEGSGGTYGSIKWVDNVPIAQGVLDALRPLVELEVEREKATTRVNEGYALAVEAGFPSTALGTTHYYPAKRDNQIDVIGSTLVAILAPANSIPFPCVDAATGVSSEKVHSSAQWTQVFLDGVAYKQTLFNSLMTQLGAISAMSLAELKAAVFIPPA